MKTNFFTDRNDAFAYLLDKYQVKSNGQLTDTGQLQQAENTFHLLPWRMERRFIELKKLIDDQTLEDVSTLRFAHLTASDAVSLDELMYRELDLCEWLGGAPVCRLFAVFNETKAANIIVKLANGLSCSVECSTMLPKGASKIDRHEIIARRGVGSDQVVDTQVPQHSIYSFTDSTKKNYTDVDAEIFGLSQNDVNLVRAGYAALTQPSLVGEWQAQYQHLIELVDLAKASDNKHQPSIINL